MTSDWLLTFFHQRPFEGFTLSLSDGREMNIEHPERENMGRFALVVLYFHPTGQFEVIDISFIVSVRTMFPSDYTNWISPPPGEVE